jgi:hypothetical protein
LEEKPIMNILQQEATVAMLRVMVNTGRAKKAELQAAELVLAEMKGEAKTEERVVQHMTKPHIEHGVATTPTIAPAMDNVETVFRRKGELMTEIKRLTSEQNGLSNTLHTVPDNQACPGLTANIVSLRKKIEGLWTEYQFISRNGNLTPTPINPTQPSPLREGYDEEDPEREIKLLRISTELRSLRDKRLKLEKKLEKPHLNTKFPEQKVPEWQTELIQVVEAISELELEKEKFA